MTDRERWTVYPLLFLALSMSLKDKLTRFVSTDTVECKTLVCEKLEVKGTEGNPSVTMMQGQLQAKNLFCQSLVATDESGKRQQIVIASTSEGGIVRTYGADNQHQASMVGGTMFCRALIVPDESGQKQLATISYNDDGGLVRTMGSQTGTHTVLGNFNRFAGLLFIDAHGAAHAGPLFASPVPLKKQAPAAQPEQQSQDNAGQATPEAAAPGGSSAQDASTQEQPPAAAPDDSGTSG